MADKKISALTAASVPLAGTEVLPIVQSGTTVKVSAADVTAGRDVSALSQTLSGGNLTFSSTAQRITGDTSNATHSNRLLFQNSVTNGNTFVGGLPNGTSQVSGINFYNNSAPANSSYVSVRVTGTEVQMQSAILGTGTYLPLAVYTNGAKQWTFDTSGNLAVANAGKGIDFSANANAPGMTSELLTWYEEGTWTPSYSGWTTNPTSVFAKYTRIGRVVIINYTGENGVSLAGVSEIGGLPFTSNSQQGASVAMKDISGSSPGVTAFGSVGASATKIGSMTSATFTGLYWSFTATYIV